MDTPQTHPVQSNRLSLSVAAIVLLLTIAFHLLVVDHPYGFAFAIFIGLMLVAIHVVALLAGWQRNSWAYIFLIPVLFGTIAEMLYANPVVRVLGFFIVLLSMAFFSYWITAVHTKFREVKSLWSWSLFMETFLPVEGGSGLVSKKSFGTTGSKILFGIVVAIPFLIIIGSLFASADPFFGKILANFFTPSPEFILKFTADIIVAVYLGRAGWAMVTRALEKRLTRYGNWHPTFDHVVLSTFLGALNVLFLIFIGFQSIYFFGGQGYIEHQGLTYADYARSGFFELLFVAGLVFAITWFMYRMSELRHRWVKVLNVALIVETGIVIASAVKRLLLYIDAYGMSVSRFWAMTVILVIAFVLFLAAMGAIMKTSYGSMSKLTFLSLLIIFSGILLFNVQGFVAKTNVERFFSGKSKTLDSYYLIEDLSSDAVPAVATLFTQPWPSISSPAEYDRADCWNYVPKPADARECYRQMLQNKINKIKDVGSKDWRNLVWSDYQAIQAVEGLK